VRYRVSHVTEYAYSEPVRDSLGVAHVVPRPLPWQQVEDPAVAIDPAPDDVHDDHDAYGNVATYFHVTSPHDRLRITGTSEVVVEAPAYDEDALAAPWERSRPLAEPDAPGAWSAAEFALESPRAAHADGAHAYASASLVPGRPLGEAVTDLVHRIHADFRYDGTATTVTSTVDEVLRVRAGVCQDFAHLALACLRSHGVAARYVSGYLATQPPPGRERVVGADASHAWVSVWMPSSGQWLSVDPTNDVWTGDRHVTVAWGRDYGDVSPVRGIIFTEAQRSTLRVSVDVAARA
jgi:transglutaminase-like putative cysteine protease